MSTLLAFSADQVSRLTGLSDQQLRYWDKTGFFRPSYADQSRRPYGRVYPFRDVVGLRTLAMLRHDYHVSLQELRKVGVWLDQHYNDPWATLRFYIAGGRIYFDDPFIGMRREGLRPEQTVIAVEMQQVATVTEVEASKLRERSANEIGRVAQNRYVAHNAPVLAGTRIRTEAIWNFHVAGFDIDDIVRQYPRLTVADVEAAIDFERHRRQRMAG